MVSTWLIFRRYGIQKLLLVIIKTMKRAKKTPVDGVFAASN
jgi:hypothetical protein